MAFVNERQHRPRRTIDYDRNVTLYRVGASGGSSEHIETFELHWNGSIISFATKQTTIDNGAKGDLHHDVMGLEIPEDLVDKKDQILDLIREALDEFGTYWNRDKVDKVSITFSPSLKA